MNMCMKNMGVWIHVLGCMGLVKFRIEKCRFLYNSMDLYSFGLERLDTWFGTFSCVWFGFGSSQTHFLLGLS